MATFPLCNDQDESLFHIFGDCVKVGPLWIPFIHISRIDSFFEVSIWKARLLHSLCYIGPVRD